MFRTLVILAADGEVAEVATVIDVRALAILGSILIPLAVQLLTRKTASEGLQATLALLGSVLVTVLAFVADPGNTVVNWVTITNTFITSVVTQLTAYLGVYKPLGVAGTIAEKTKGFGFSSPPTVETPDKGEEDVAQRGVPLDGGDDEGLLAGEPDPDEPDPDERQAIQDELGDDTPRKAPLHPIDEDPLQNIGEEVPVNKREGTF